IYLLMMATAFMGYVLPWGQMSYWGAQVITGFFSAFPLVGEPIRVWLLGGYAPDQATLTRFFSLHYLLPFVIAGVVILHIWSLHIPGSGNPTGVDVREEQDTLPFHPFYTAKDGWFAAAFLTLYAIVTFYAPNYLGHADNYIPANALSTPAHIVPEWYFWPFYAILRSFTADFILPAKLWGVLAMFTSILLLFFLPWLDKSPVRSGSYRPVFKRFFLLLVIDVLVLGYVGGAEITPFNIALGQIAAAYYFLHFLVILPIVSAFETPLPLPDSISSSALHGEAAEAAPAGQKPRRGSVATAG
ncbi:MAG TPA: cytochrome b N-terminal domain-containing protein, partial [Sphingomicrobium sp.]